MSQPEKVRILVRLPREGWWWDQAKSHLETDPDEVPELARPLIQTETRTSALPYDDALRIRDWARSLPGWEEEPGLRFVSYPYQTAVDWHDD
jgi:hypothetical protein